MAGTADHPDAAAVDAHLAGLPEPQRSTVLALRATLRKVLPAAEEGLRYGMPCFLVRGKAVAGYDGFTDHCSYFPHSGSVLQRVEGIPDGWATTKGTLQFPVDRPLPVGLVRKLVRARLGEISQVADGKRLDFYDDGTLRSEGSMKAGEMHGAWRWYRKDGSLMRTGRFRSGEQVGTWETWDRDGNLVKATTY